MPTIIGRSSNDCSEFSKDPVKGDQREFKRREYKPSPIKVLFACESLPNDTDNFFYYKHSVLFDNTLKAFQNVFPKITQATFLDRFKELGFYLDDLCSEPVNQLKNTEAEKKKRICLRKLYETEFAKRVAVYQPKFVIITPNGIEENILNVLALANCSVDYKALPFPSKYPKHIKDYIDELTELLRELIKKKIIC